MKRAPPPSASAASTRPSWRCDDRGDDREPEPGAGPAALAPALGAPEALEQRVARRRRAGRGRGRGRRRRTLAVLAPDRDLDRRPRGRVHERVAQEVAEHLAQLERVGGDDGAARRPRARSRGRAPWRARRRPRRAASARDVDGLAHRVAHLVQAREREQVLDEHAHARRLVLDPPHRLLDLLGRARGAHAEQLGVAADRGERRAQLVRRVGEEAPQPLLARLRARRTPPRAARASR